MSRDAQNEKYSAELYSLWQIFIGLKVLSECNVYEKPKHKDPFFELQNTEIVKLILGRLCILLFDSKDQKYYTMSFKILIGSLLKDHNFHDLHNNNELLKLLREIEEKESRYKEYRDKSFAHIELNDDSSLRRIEDYNITSQDILDLLNLAQRCHDVLLKHFNGGGTKHMASNIEKFSQKLKQCFVDAGLIELQINENADDSL